MPPLETGNWCYGPEDRKTSLRASYRHAGKAGIQVSFGLKYKKGLDSGMRRNDGSETSLSLEKQRTFRLNPENRRAVAG